MQSPYFFLFSAPDQLKYIVYFQALRAYNNYSQAHKISSNVLSYTYLSYQKHCNIIFAVFSIKTLPYLQLKYFRKLSFLQSPSDTANPLEILYHLF